MPGAATAVGRLLAERETLRLLNLRQAERAVAGVPGPEGNLSKMIQAEHAQRVADLAFLLAGAGGAFVDGDEAAAVQSFLFTRCLTIAGGTSEIVRNQVGRAAPPDAPRPSDQLTDTPASANLVWACRTSVSSRRLRPRVVGR